MLQSMGSQRAGHDLVTEQQSCFLCGIQIPGSAPSADRRNCFMLGVGRVGRRGISDVSAGCYEILFALCTSPCYFCFRCVQKCLPKK